MENFCVLCRTYNQLKFKNSQNKYILKMLNYLYVFKKKRARQKYTVSSIKYSSLLMAYWKLPKWKQFKKF